MNSSLGISLPLRTLCILLVLSLAQGFSSIACADISFPGGNVISLEGDGNSVNGGIVFTDGFGGTSNITATLMQSGTVGNMAGTIFEETEIVRVLNGNGIEARIEDKLGADGQTAWHSTMVFDLSSAVNGLTIQRGNLFHSDWVDWQIDWSGSSGMGTLVDNDLGMQGADLWDTTGVGGSLLADGSFASGTMFRYDDNDTPDERPGVGAAGNPWFIELPDGITSITISSWVHDMTGETINFQDEGVTIIFSDATVVPEPTSLILLSGLVLALGVRRRR